MASIPLMGTQSMNKLVDVDRVSVKGVWPGSLGELHVNLT